MNLYAKVELVLVKKFKTIKSFKKKIKVTCAKECGFLCHAWKVRF